MCTVSVRDRVQGDIGALPLAELVARLSAEVREKRMHQSEAGAGNGRK